MPRIGRVVIDPGVQLPLTSADPDTDPTSELVTSLVLHWARTGAVTKRGEHYLDHGHPTPDYLAGALDGLTGAGLLTLTHLDPHGSQQVTLTTAGHIQYQQLCDVPRPTSLPVPEPQVPTTKTPAGRRFSSPTPLPVPGGQPTSDLQNRESNGGPLRWVCWPDGRLHLLQPADVAAGGGHTQALCGRTPPAAALTFTHGLAGAVCSICITGINPTQRNPDSMRTARPTPDQCTGEDPTGRQPTPR